MGTLVAVIYFSIAILLIWPINQYMIKDVLGEARPEPIDRVFGGFISTAVSILWPLVIGIFIAVKLSKYIWERFLGEDREKVK